MIIQIGTNPDTGKPVTLNLQAAISSHLMLEGNTNAGKSYTLRVLSERVYGKMPHILVDPEGEYASLRDKFGYLLAGEGGEIKLHNETAGKLAETLIENGIYAIINLYGMGRDLQYEWLATFLERLMNLPRNIWRPAIITIDEAHRFAPEQGKGERKNDAQQRCSRAIKELFSAGGKRGYLGICATQRWAKIAKDAISEIQNYMVGKTFYPEDIERAAKALGIPTRKETFQPFSETIRTFHKGQFFVFGSALSEELIQVKVDQAQTKHPERGKPQAAPPPTPESIKALLPKLAEIPKQVEEEAKERGEALRIITERHEQIVALNRTVDELRERLHIAENNISADKADRIAQFTRQQMIELLQPYLLTLGRGINQLVQVVEHLGGQIDQVLSTVKELQNPIQGVMTAMAETVLVVPPDLSYQSPAVADQKRLPVVAASPSPKLVKKTRPETSDQDGQPEELGQAHRAILSALAQYPQGRSRKQIALLTNYAAGGGSFRGAMSELERWGLRTDGEPSRITPEGLRKLGSYTPLPTGHALIEKWYTQLPKMGADILRVLVRYWPHTRTRAEIGEELGKAAAGGSFREACSHLKTYELITGKNDLKANDELFKR